MYNIIIIIAKLMVVFFLLIQQKEKYQLRVNFTTRQCMRSYLNETFRPFSIPYDARLVDVLEIGSNIAPDLGIEVSVWEGETNGK